VLALAAPAVHGASADPVTVRLRNGDRITGAVRKEGDTLVVTTPYAGDVRIRWTEVEELSSANAIFVLMRDGDVRAAQQLGGPGGAPDVRLADIAILNPTVGQLGQGFDYSGNVTLAANLTGGNSQAERFYGEARLRARGRTRRFSLGGLGTYATDNGAATVDKWLVNADHDWFFTPRQFLYARGSGEHDQFADIHLRVTAGGGYGYQLIDTPATQLSLQGGLDYVWESRDIQPDNEYPALGWGARYGQWVLERRLQAFHEQDGFLSLDEVGNVVVRTRTGLRAPVLRGLNLNVQLNYDWQSDPPPDTGRGDWTWVLGFGYLW
jgi:putative salt-induced outer membrane protein YdiY